MKILRKLSPEFTSDSVDCVTKYVPLAAVQKALLILPEDSLLGIEVSLD